PARDQRERGPGAGELLGDPGTDPGGGAGDEDVTHGVPRAALGRGRPPHSTGRARRSPHRSRRRPVRTRFSTGRTAASLTGRTAAANVTRALTRARTCPRTDCASSSAASG